MAVDVSSSASFVLQPACRRGTVGRRGRRLFANTDRTALGHRSEGSRFRGQRQGSAVGKLLGSGRGCPGGRLRRVFRAATASTALCEKVALASCRQAASAREEVAEPELVPVRGPNVDRTWGHVRLPAVEHDRRGTRNRTPACLDPRRTSSISTRHYGARARIAS